MSGGIAEARTVIIQEMVGEACSIYLWDKGGACSSGGSEGDRERRTVGIGRGRVGYIKMKGGD